VNGSRKPLVTEERRRTATLILMWGGWIGAGIVTLLRLGTVNDRRDGVMLGPEWGSVIVLLTGIGVAATLARSRMRLTQIITGVFEAGLKAAANDRGKRAALIEVNLDGKITSTENAQVIHWNTAVLKGQPLELLIPERFRDANREWFAKVRDTGESALLGPTLHAPVLGQDGVEYPTQISMIKFGDEIIATLSPVKS
jgi:hypothetical protein